MKHMKRLASLAVLGTAFGVVPSMVMAQEISPKISANPAKVLSATYFGGAGSEWLTTGGVLANGDIFICGNAVDPEIELMGKKATLFGIKDGPTFKPYEKWVMLAEADTGKMRGTPQHVLDEAAGFATAGPGGGDEDEVNPLDDPDADLFGMEETKAEKKQKKEKKKKKDRATQKKIRSVPRHYKWTIEEDAGAVKEYYTKLHPEMPNATGFIAVLSPDLKLKSLQRLPRGAGSITSAVVADDGAVYISGVASSTLANFAKPTRIEKDKNKYTVADSKFGARQTFVAKLSPTVDKVDWLVAQDGWSIVPRLTKMKDGSVTVHGNGIRTYDSNGKRTNLQWVPLDRVLTGLSVSPVNGEYARIGDWMSPTGREPYRIPRLAIMNADGTPRVELWSWRGPFAGIDHCRLVADSAVRRSMYTPTGELTISSWSHGGNNVMFRYPYDIERFMPNNLAFQTNETCAVIAKFDKDYNIIASTYWGGNVKEVNTAGDGSVIAVVSAAHNIENLPNRLSRKKSGKAVMITDPDINGIRFMSQFPGVAERAVVVGCDYSTDGWGWATGESNGRTILLGLSSAVPGEIVTNEGKFTVPQKDALQAEFGGGLTDGYLVVMDITADKPFKPWRTTTKKAPKAKRPYDGELSWPENGQEFRSGGESYCNAKITMRDLNDKWWPFFVGGNTGLGGVITYSDDPEEAKINMSIELKRFVLPAGDQSQRVAGELLAVHTEKVENDKGKMVERGVPSNPITVRFNTTTAWEPRPDTDFARVGGAYSPKATATFGGTMDVGERTVAIENAKCVAIYKGTKAQDPDVLPNHVLYTVTFQVRGGDIGLTGERAEEQIQCQVAFTAYSDSAPKSGW